MNQLALLDLPLGGGESSTPSRAERPVAGGETLASSSAAIGQQPAPNEQYLRLFGTLSPEQVMLGTPLPAHCDPSQAAGCPFPSALDAVALARAKQRANGFTPETDAQHGPTWFWHGVHEFWWRAQDEAHDRARRRKAKVAAAALIIASIEVDDFHAQQEAAQ